MNSTAVLLSTLLVAPTGAVARDVVIRQTDRANVYGAVQAGPQSGTLTVEQSGAVNIVGIVQAVPNGGTVVLQKGQRNTALVGQFAPVLSRQLP